MKFFVAILLVIAMITCGIVADEPISKEERAKIMQTCFKLLRTSPAARGQFTQMQFSDADEDSELHCVIRCGGIVSGMYDDETGWSVEQAARQAQGKTGIEEYKSAFESCAAAIDPDRYGQDYCKKSFLKFRCGMRAWKEHIKDAE